MSTDEYVPSDEEMYQAYRRNRPLDHYQDVEAAFAAFLARVRRDAVEEYKNRQVQVHISPAPTQMVPVPMRCPKCGHR